MDKLDELVDAVERRTLSIDRDRTEEELIVGSISGMIFAMTDTMETLADALTRLVSVCDGLGWVRTDDDALSEANKALAAYAATKLQVDEDDEGDVLIGPDDEEMPS